VPTCRKLIEKFYNFKFILFIFLFRARYIHMNISASRFVELCLDVVVSEKSSYVTHTSYFLKPSLTTFFFTPHTFRWDILAASLSRTETDQPFVECCSTLPTFAIIFSLFVTRRNREFLGGIFLVR